VDLGGFADTGRMNGSSSWDGKTTTARSPSAAPKSPALFYSLLETASMLGVDPKAYLRAAAAAALQGHAPLLPHAYKLALAHRA
jgi:hypothetical protein